jgi:hypothetical protein
MQGLQAALDRPPHVPADWTAIHDCAHALVIEPRDAMPMATAAAAMAQAGPFERRGAGPVAGAVAALGALPAAIGADIACLAGRFAALMQVATVRIRFEAITTNACRKIHADNTDVRLITTYTGSGTLYVPAGCAPQEASLQPIPTGWIALFKGRAFAQGHEPCLHRSPRAGDIGEKRLVLVIDTPLREPLEFAGPGTRPVV